MEVPSSSLEKVFIDGYETWVQDRRFTVFKVYVKTARQAWFVFRRYNQFNSLHHDLKKGGNAHLPKFPKKRIMGNNFDTAFIVHRMRGLDRFLREVFENKEIIESHVFREFLSLNNTRGAVMVVEEKVDVSEFKLSDQDSSWEDQVIDLGKPEVSLADFKLMKCVGKGNFGKVLLAQHLESEKYYAIKVLQKSSIMKKNKTRQIMAERNVLMASAKHPFLVGLHYSFQSSRHLFLVLDYINGGELFYHLQLEQSFSEQRTLFYAAEITSALGYLHSMSIIYRDLKPENILLDGEGHVRITDFGLCKEKMDDGDTTGTFCGTPEYLAPEVLHKQPYTKAVDWWCLGCVVHEMLFGLPPWYSRNMAEMYDGILNKMLTLPPSATSTTREVLKALLMKDPTERLGYTGGAQALMSHPYFKTIDWGMLYERKIPPPWNPTVCGSNDTANISEEFTTEAVTESFHGDDEMGSGEEDFEGFAYAAE